MKTIFQNTSSFKKERHLLDTFGSPTIRARDFILNKFWAVLFLSLLVLSIKVSAQQTNLACNNETAMSLPGFTLTPGTAALTGAVVGGITNLTTTSTSDFATATLTASRSGITCLTTSPTATATIRVNGTESYTGGNYVGFVVSNDLSGFSSVTVRTINSANAPVSTSTSPSILSIGGGLFEVGFVSGAGAFTGIEIVLEREAPVLLDGCVTFTPAVNIFNAFQVKYCDANALPANTPVNASLPDYNLSVSSSGNLLTLGVFDEEDAISPSTTDFANVVQVAGISFLQVNDNVTTYPAGTFAGFSISAANLISLSLLGEITIETRLNGTFVDNATGAGLLLSGQLLSPGSRNNVGFTSNGAFNQVRISFSGLGLGNTQIYNAVFERFEEGPAIACNTPTQLSSPAYPLTVSQINTGITGAACVGCSVSSQDNVIDSDLDTPATINVLAAVGAEGSVSVKKEGVPYPAGTFAGFSVGNSQLVGLDLLSSITITTYLNGVEQDQRQGSGGLANVGLLTGSRQTIGFLTEDSFDEIKITVTQLAGVVQTTAVYGPVITSFCNDTPLACNTPTNVVNPTHSVFVNSSNTAINTALCVSCSITGTQNVTDGTSANDFATIDLGATALNVAGFAVKNAITDYPIGTYTGFDILTASLLDVQALSAIRIRTYLDGVETSFSSTTGYTGTALLVGANLLTSTGRQVVGVVSEDIFDEVKIEFTNLADVPLGTIQVYNAVFQSLCNDNPIVCGTTEFLTTPEQPVVIESSRTGITGVCALCEVNDPANVISTSTLDFATISVPVGAVGSASISVKNGVVDYPANSVIGFTIRDVESIVQLQLLNSLTLTTYLDGQPTGESATGNTLISLQLLLPLIGNGGEPDIYNVNFRPTLPFDEVRLSVSGVAGLLNEIEVYGAFVTPASDGGVGGGCATPVLTFKDIPFSGYVGLPYNDGTVPKDVADYTGVNETYSVAAGTGFNQLPPGLSMNATTGVISGRPDGPIGLYTFLVEVRDQNNVLIGQRLYQINVNSSLPVTLVSFSAAKEGNTTLLKWATADEVNSERFDVERSENGKSWLTIATKPAMGQSRVTKAYTLTDAKPAAGVNYYRLKMVDLDGTFAFSKIEAVNFGANGEASVYPNPVGNSEFIMVNVSDWSTVSSLRIVDLNGKMVYEVAGTAGNKISTRNLRSGLYFVQIRHLNGSTSSYKFAKQ